MEQISSYSILNSSYSFHVYSEGRSAEKKEKNTKLYGFSFQMWNNILIYVSLYRIFCYFMTLNYSNGQLPSI